MQRKLLAGIVIVMIAMSVFAYKHFSSAEENETQYSTAEVTRGTIVVTASGSGQVAALDEVDVSSEVSGEIAYVGVEDNQEVTKGTLIVKLNSRDAEKSLREAEIDLANAQNKSDILADAEESLAEAYEDGIDILTDSFDTLSPMMNDLSEMFLESSWDSDATNDVDYYLDFVRFYLEAYKENLSQLSFWDGSMINEAEKRYKDIQEEYESINEGYAALSYQSPYADIASVLDQTYDMVRDLLSLARQSSNVAQKYQEIAEEENLIPAISTTISDGHASQLSAYTSSLISMADSLLSAKESIADENETMENIDLDIAEQELSIRQYEYNLEDAQEKLDQHYIYADFDGVITDLDVEAGDSVSSGTVLAKLTTSQKVAEITLNEVDIADIAVGQKATITFDALDDVSVIGEVLNIDSAGTVSQGVVTYDLQIVFDCGEETRIKDGMSVSAEIIIQSRQEVLMVPNTVIKYQGEVAYVEILSDDGIISDQQVEIGISSDMYTEIISGVKQGERVVGSAASSANSSDSSNSFNFGSMNGGGGGMNMMMR